MQENTAKTATEWVFVARSVTQLPGGHDVALRCMARAEVLAQSVDDWLAVATAWRQDFDEIDRSQQCLGKAESHANDSGAWERIAYSWTEMDCFVEAVDCHKKSIELGEEQKGSERDFLVNARATVNEAHGNYTRAINTMARAEAFATFCEISSVWIHISEVWKWDFRDSVNVIRCLEEAEGNAGDADEWEAISNAWRELGQESRADKADRKAKSSFF